MIKDVTISVTRQTAPLSSAGFGMPLIVATNANQDYKEYTNIGDVSGDYAVTTSAYKMAQAVFAQNPKPEKLAIVGVAYTPTAMQWATLTTSLGVNNAELTYTPKIPGLKGNYVRIAYVDPGELTESTTAGITGSGTSTDPYVVSVTLASDGTNITAKASDVKTAIEADTNCNSVVKVDYATGNDGTGTVEALAATSLSGGSDGSDASVLVSKLSALILSHNDWYYLLCDQHNYNEISVLSPWAEANNKEYFAVTKDDNLIDFEVINADHTTLFYHDQDTKYPDAAWVGIAAASLPGEITFKFKTLQGIPVANVDDARVSELHSHNCNTYVNKYGVLQTSEGLASSGEYIDVITGQDWVVANLAQEVHRAISATKKVPYDNKGIALILSAVLNVLREATAQGIILQDENGNGVYSASAPLRSQISQTDRANRNLPNVKFNYTIAGAVHTVDISGTITV